MKPPPVLFGGVTVAALEPPNRGAAAALTRFGVGLELRTLAFSLLAGLALLGGAMHATLRTSRRVERNRGQQPGELWRLRPQRAFAVLEVGQNNTPGDRRIINVVRF